MQRLNWLPPISLAALALVSACSGSDPAGPGDTGDPKMTTELRWDVDVVARYVKASSVHTCDGSGILGLGNPGEYQYRITASYGGVTKSYQTSNYGSVTGANASLDVSEIDNFTNQTWRFTSLRSGEGVVLTMRVTEWDGTNKDSDMNDKSNSLTVVPSSLLPTGGTKTDRALGVGDSSCGLTLYYDVIATQRSVTVN